MGTPSRRTGRGRDERIREGVEREKRDRDVGKGRGKEGGGRSRVAEWLSPALVVLLVV